MNIINFCKQTCRPQETALYALGGFLSGRCMGDYFSYGWTCLYGCYQDGLSLVSQKFNKKALSYLEEKISSVPQSTNPQSSYLDRLKSRSGHLATSWVDLVQSKLLLLKEPMNFMNRALSKLENKEV